MAKLSIEKPVKPVNKKKKRKQKPKKNKLSVNDKTVNDTSVDVKKEEIESDVKIKEQNDEATKLNDIPDEVAEKYPVLVNQELVNRMIKVKMSNNQKGRIRQQLKDNLKGTCEELLPEVINNRIQAIVKNIINLTDAELRKIRILYNMLKTSIQTSPGKVQKKKKKKNKKSKNKIKKEKDKIDEEKDPNEIKDNNGVKNEIKDEIKHESKDQNDIKNEIKDSNEQKDKDGLKIEKKDKKQKKKGPKRYVAFVGNLPLDIDKEMIMHHFYEIRDQITDVRIQTPAEGKKSCIAYLELKNEPSFELALSKHHSMLGSRRINVLYTVQKNSKMSTAEAKGKAAKLVALKKSGKLMGSVPLNRKRSQRRMKAKKARAKLEAEMS